jgi:hypothetical protein
MQCCRRFNRRRNIKAIGMARNPTNTTAMTTMNVVGLRLLLLLSLWLLLRVRIMDESEGFVGLLCLKAVCRILESLGEKLIFWFGKD